MVIAGILSAYYAQQKSRRHQPSGHVVKKHDGRQDLSLSDRLSE